VIPFDEPVPLAINDITHGLIFGYVLISAIGEKGKSILPEPSKEQLRWLPFIAVMIVCAATMLACVFEDNNPKAVIFSIPLLAFALIGTAKTHGEIKTRKAEERWDVFLGRIAAGIAVFCIVYWLRVPFHRNTRLFSEALQAGVERLNTGDFAGAERQLRKAIEARPDQAGGRAILAHVLIENGNDAEARKQLETALLYNQTHQTALILLTTLDLKEKRWKEAQVRADKGHKLYPRRPEFVYQSIIAERNLKNESPAVVVEAVEVARRGGQSMLQSLASLAMSLNDPLTARACEQR
jgi:tetratricopeptide (TPR) repeat protein